jgi:TPR repeat protein
LVVTTYAAINKAGHAISCGYLGFRYGNRVPHDTTKAAALYRKACDGGDAVSCRKLKTPLYNADAADAADAAAAAQSRKKCDAGDMRACSALAFDYEYGIGVDHDPTSATTLYRKACQGGQKQACSKTK